MAPVSLVDHLAVEERDPLAVGKRAVDRTGLGTLGCRRAENPCDHLELSRVYRPLAVEAEVTCGPRRRPQAGLIGDVEKRPVERLHTCGTSCAQHPLLVHQPAPRVALSSAATELGTEIGVSDQQRNQRLFGDRDFVCRD